MDSLEANFPHLFPKAPTQQELIPLWKRHGDRGFASDEVLRSGNQVQCDQTYLDGLLLEQCAIKTAILENPRAFGLCEVEAFDEGVAPFVTKAADDLMNLNLEVRRLRSHPELFSDTQTRTKFLQQSAKTVNEISRILDGHVPDLIEATRAVEKASAPEKPVAPVSQRQPWQTWCSLLSIAVTQQAQPLKDFKANHPDMVLVGEQIVPHMGVLIAERWRQQVENIIVSLAEKRPEITEYFPKVDRMISGVKGKSSGRAVLRFSIDQPNAAKAGHVFAFGPQDKVAEFARMIASCKWNNDITRLGMPRAVMFGIFITREEAKKFPHLRHLE